MALFSLQELDIADDPYILLIKNRIMEKVRGLMEELEQDLNLFLLKNNHPLPKEINLKHGKISKGENYKHLPFYILDYPALFTKDHIFAFRTMFYWGNFISFTLHLQGDYAKIYGADLVDSLQRSTSLQGIYFCVNDTPWEYLYEESNYRLLSSINTTLINSQIENNYFIKLSCKTPISDIHNSSEVMMEFFQLIISGLNRNKS
jgi:hypothetical protein